MADHNVDRTREAMIPNFRRLSLLLAGMVAMHVTYLGPQFDYYAELAEFNMKNVEDGQPDECLTVRTDDAIQYKHGHDYRRVPPRKPGAAAAPAGAAQDQHLMSSSHRQETIHMGKSLHPLDITVFVKPPLFEKMLNPAPWTVAVGQHIWPLTVIKPLHPTNWDQGAVPKHTIHTSCTGSLIHANLTWIITAAHCLESPWNRYYVTAGTLCRPERGGLKHHSAQRLRVVRDYRPLTLPTTTTGVEGGVYGRPGGSTQKGFPVYAERLHVPKNSRDYSEHIDSVANNDIALLRVIQPFKQTLKTQIDHVPLIGRDDQIGCDWWGDDSVPSNSLEAEYNLTITTSGWGLFKRRRLPTWLRILNFYHWGAPDSVFSQEPLQVGGQQGANGTYKTQKENLCKNEFKIQLYYDESAKPQTCSGDSGGGWVRQPVTQFRTPLAYGVGSPAWQHGRGVHKDARLIAVTSTSLFPYRMRSSQRHLSTKSGTPRPVALNKEIQDEWPKKNPHKSLPNHRRTTSDPPTPDSLGETLIPKKRQEAGPDPGPGQVSNMWWEKAMENDLKNEEHRQRMIGLDDKTAPPSLVSPGIRYPYSERAEVRKLRDADIAHPDDVLNPYFVHESVWKKPGSETVDIPEDVLIEPGNWPRECGASEMVAAVKVCPFLEWIEGTMQEDANRYPSD